MDKNIIQKELIAVKEKSYMGNELMFNPETGELLVKKIHEPKPNPDSTVVSQMAEEGFF